MWRGGFEPLPGRHGGDGGLESQTAEQQSRMANDVAALWRTVPLAVVSCDSSGSVTHYLGRNAAGSANAPTVTKNSTGNYTVTWPTQYENDLEEDRAFMIRTAGASSSESGSTGHSASVTSISANSVTVETYDVAGSALADAGFTLDVYGDYGPQRTIGLYGGSKRKRNDTSEHPIPYAASIYRDLQSQVGSAYTRKSGTFVHVKHLTRSRFWAYIGYRLPDEFRSNSVPDGADSGQAYWEKVLGLPKREGEDNFQLRDRHRIHYRAGSQAATYNNVFSDVSDLLGDAFVSITLNHGEGLESPRTNTYWPTINPGPDTYDLGGGTWLSDRLQVIFNVAQPGGMSSGEFSNLINVDLFEYLDRALPAWVSPVWSESGENPVVWDGGIEWDSGAVWGSLYDWKI